eukprot:COSAG05_NODE_9414_length_625_cov_1.125475_1_plen_76_part_10
MEGDVKNVVAYPRRVKVHPYLDSGLFCRSPALSATGFCWWWREAQCRGSLRKNTPLMCMQPGIHFGLTAVGNVPEG